MNQGINCRKGESVVIKIRKTSCQLHQMTSYQNRQVTLQNLAIILSWKLFHMKFKTIFASGIF